MELGGQLSLESGGQLDRNMHYIMHLISGWTRPIEAKNSCGMQMT